MEDAVSQRPQLHQVFIQTFKFAATNFIHNMPWLKKGLGVPVVFVFYVDCPCIKTNNIVYTLTQ